MKSCTEIHLAMRCYLLGRKAEDRYTGALQLPVIVTNCRETAKFVTESKVGLMCEATPDSLSNAILTLISDEGLYNSLRANTHSTLVEGNLWVHRVKTMADTLSGQKR